MVFCLSQELFQTFWFSTSATGRQLLTFLLFSNYFMLSFCPSTAFQNGTMVSSEALNY